MRKVTELTVKAFLNGEKKTVGNTVSTGTELILHGNVIARKDAINPDLIYISSAGWQTPTTKERLNGLLSMLNEGYIYQKNFEWFWNDGKPFHPTEWYLV